MPPRKQPANPKKRKADAISASEPADTMTINTSSKPVKQSARLRKLNNGLSSTTVDSVNDKIQLVATKSDQTNTQKDIIPLVSPPAQPLLNKTSSSKTTKEEVKNEEVKGAPVASEYPNLTKFFKPKPFTDHTTTHLGTLVKYVEVTILELANLIKEEEKMKHRKDGEEESCSICMCELYDGLHEMIKKGEDQKIQDLNQLQMTQKAPIDVVIMNKCTDHCFHRECLENQLG